MISIFRTESQGLAKTVCYKKSLILSVESIFAKPDMPEEHESQEQRQQQTRQRLPDI